jgi:serine/threonine protein phosphatase PrpC
MSLPHSPAGPWRVIGCSVRGASHVRAALENQDAIGWIPADGTGTRVVLSVADGHGSPKSFRSAIGAQLAIEVSHGLAAELLSAAPAHPGLSLVKDRLEHEVPRRVVREWRARVDDHLSRSPFADEELALVQERDGQQSRELVEKDPHLAYGSTLVTAVAMESFMAFWQIGDGDVLTVSAAGGVGRPLPGDELLMGNETTSLCSADAWRLFRVAVFGTPAPLILVSTDGFSNSFQDDEGLFRFGSDVLRMVITDGIGSVNGRLDAWLREMTQTGSGDDISLGVICRPGALPVSPPESPETANSAEPQPRESLASSPAPGMAATAADESGNGGARGESPPPPDHADTHPGFPARVEPES